MEHDINNLKIEVAVINEKLDSQSKKLDMVIQMIENHTRDENARFEEFAKTKAERWVQHFVTGFISVLCVTVLGAFLRLIIIQ
jgi:hypothetical protein